MLTLVKEILKGQKKKCKKGSFMCVHGRLKEKALSNPPSSTWFQRLYQHTESEAKVNYP